MKRYDDTHNFTCDVCGREVFCSERVCRSCLDRLPWVGEVYCPLCGRKEREPGVCLECKREPLAVKKARSLFTHEGEAARLVLRFKRGEKYLVRACCELLLPLCRREFPEIEGLTFVPMTKKAEKRRGYNQSCLLAQRLSELLNVPLFDVIEKVRETEAQKVLGKRERAKNLEGCFRVSDRKAVREKYLLLVDDTLTTGATSSELAGALLRAGARRVDLVTVTGVQDRAPFGLPPNP